MGSLLPTLIGCSPSLIRATTDGGRSFQTWSKEEVDSVLKCDLRVCVLHKPAPPITVYVEDYPSYFAELKFAQDMAHGKTCDVGLRAEDPTAMDTFDIVSAFTGETVANIQAHFTRAPNILCRLFAPTTELGRKLAVWRTGSTAPIVATTQPAPDVAADGSEMPSYKSAERPDDLALIVGIESYSDIASKASFAERDADAFKAHVRALGVPDRNIVLLKGSKAGKASLEKYLETWLPRLSKPDSRVYFYFSGHGAPDVKSSQAYLVPWDGDPNFLKNTAYPLERLYQKLGELPVKQVLVVMDSCFSGAGGRSVLASGARPLVTKIETDAVPAKVTILAASAADEISGSLEDRRHGAFTYFLLEGLNAGKTTPKALAVYLTPLVQDEARRLNRDQTPQLRGDGNWMLR